jgi:hypothetical protein
MLDYLQQVQCTLNLTVAQSKCFPTTKTKERGLSLHTYSLGPTCYREKIHNFIEIQNLYNLYIYYSIYIYSFTSLKIHVDIEDSHWAGENPRTLTDYG